MGGANTQSDYFDFSNSRYFQFSKIPDFLCFACVKVFVVTGSKFSVPQLDLNNCPAVDQILQAIIWNGTQETLMFG